MKSVIVHRAQAREQHGAPLESLGQVGVPEESLQIKRLPLDEKVVFRGDIRKHHVTTVSRKHHRVRCGIHRPCLRLEFAIKEIVE